MASDLANQLRWFESLQGLVGRRDREEALLNRAEQLDRRLEVAERSAGSLRDARPSPPEEQMERIEADMRRILDLYDEVSEGVRQLERSRQGRASSGPVIRDAGSGVVGRLPTLDLPRFTGNLREWSGFRSMFASLVDSRTDLTRAEKLAYLRTSLEGEALSLIQHLELDDDNFGTAMELLETRFQNPRLLADAHVSQILGLPKVTERSQLRPLILTPVKVAYNALRSLGLPVEHWSFLLVHILLGKVPLELRARFERERGLHGDPKVFPTFEELLRVLEWEARMAESAPQEAPPVASARGPAGTGPRPTNPRTQGAVKRTATVTSASEQECPNCGQLHALVQCPALLARTTSERRGIVRRLRRCYGCLGGHLYNDCPTARPCPGCGGPHHQLLCTRSDGAGRQPSGRGPSTGGGAPTQSHALYNNEVATAWSTPPPPQPTAAPGSPTRGVLHVARSPTSQPARTRANWRGGGVIPESPRGPPPQRYPSPPLDPRLMQWRAYTPPLHEHPRLDYHPPYFQYGRAAGYAPPPMALCTRQPYWAGPGSPTGSDGPRRD